MDTSTLPGVGGASAAVRPSTRVPGGRPWKSVNSRANSLLRNAKVALLFVALLMAFSIPDARADDVPWTTMHVTAYCMQGRTADGGYTHDGVIAAPSSIPFGSLLEIDGLGVYRVEDRGDAITSGRLDVWMSSCNAAVNFGYQELPVRMLRYSWLGA